MTKKIEVNPRDSDKNSAEGNVLYRVQVGAYREQENAANMLDNLKAAGFDGFIVSYATSQANEPETNWWDSIKHFERKEFECHFGGRYCNGYPAEPAKQLVQVADRIREHFGAAAIVSSGVRCKNHNAIVGGISGSRHLTGKAMDFCVTGKSAAHVLNYVKQQPEINYAYAIDSQYVHMDIL